MTSEPRSIFIIAGELSGDMIASLLIRELRALDPEIQVTGLGGERMQAAGAEILVNMVRDLAIIGFGEVVWKYPKIRGVFYRTLRWIEHNRPDVVVLIDYPGFNVRIAERIHAMGVKVVYYATPQTWAWHRSRNQKLARDVDKALPILPFEESFLRQDGVNAEFVGTWLLDNIQLTMDKRQVCEHFGLDPDKRLIGLLPGSRRREVESLLPVMLEAAEKIRAELPDTQFVLPRASTVRAELIEHLLTLAQVDVTVVDAYRYNVRAAMDLAIVASGTATLETGLLGTPMIIVYKVALLSWLIGKHVARVPYIGLINLVAGDMVVPELIQDKCTPQNIADRALLVLQDEREREKMEYQLGKVRQKMGGPGASARVARIVLDMADHARAEAAGQPAPEDDDGPGTAR